MIRQRTVTQYRVVSTRAGGIVTKKQYGSMRAVQARIGRLTSDTPWRFYGDPDQHEKTGDDYVCCAGTRYDECNCGGETWRQRTERERAELPPIESIVVQKRTVTRTTWQDTETPAVPVFAAETDAEEEAAVSR